MVGTPPQPFRNVGTRMGNRAGMALAAAIGALTALSVLLSATWIIVDLNVKSSLNRESAVRAMLVAESGAAHTLSLLRGDLSTRTFDHLLMGSDSVRNTADDALLMGYGLATADFIPDTGLTVPDGKYFVTLLDDAADNDGDPLKDSNNRILARCRGITGDGASAVIEMVIGVTPLPGFVTDGSLTINGNPDVLGACGSVHANQIVVVSGNPTVAQGVSASDTVTVSGSIQDANGNPVTPLHHQPPIEIPALDPMDYCGDADYILEADGTFITVAPPSTQDANGNEVEGWKLVGTSPPRWDVSGNSMAAGTYCVQGNVKISGNPSGPGNTSLPLTILATGSVGFSGNPQVTPAHPDGIAVISGGDIEISGNPSSDGYEGVFYARSQCRINGNPTINGQVMCDDEPNAAGTDNDVNQNAISGNPTITYNCSGLFGGKRRVLAWYQRLGI